jgi:hypothetical protein
MRGVSVAEIWQIIERDLETLREAIIKILPPLAELERQIADDEEPTES